MSAFISKFSAWSFVIRRSCVIQSKDFDKSVKRASNIPPLSKIFLTFSDMAIRACWMLYFFCENLTEILIRYFLSFGLFDHKWHAHKLLKGRVRYSPVDSWFYHYGFLFKDWTNVCFFFNWSGNFPSTIYLLKFCKIKLEKISTWSLREYPLTVLILKCSNCWFHLEFLRKWHFEKRTCCYLSFL